MKGWHALTAGGSVCRLARARCTCPGRVGHLRFIHATLSPERPSSPAQPGRSHCVRTLRVRLALLLISRLYRNCACAGPGSNDACGDERVASIERGTADEAHQGRPLSPPTAARGCHIGNSGNCYAAEPPLAYASGNRTGGRSQIPHLLPYSFFLPFPSVVSCMEIDFRFPGTTDSVDHAPCVARKAGVPGPRNRADLKHDTQNTILPPRNCRRVHLSQWISDQCPRFPG